MRYNPFVWTQDCQKAFEDIKSAFQDAPVLAHFDPERETWIETDSSGFVSAGILSQMHNGILRPVAFFSKKLSPG
jgi:reverse transcriptase-like protein